MLAEPGTASNHRARRDRTPKVGPITHRLAVESHVGNWASFDAAKHRDSIPRPQLESEPTHRVEPAIASDPQRQECQTSDAANCRERGPNSVGSHEYDSNAH